jgi:hypothetical protein
MINITADTTPFLDTVSEIRSLARLLDNATYRQLFELLDGLPDKLFIDLMNRSAVNTGEITVVAEPSYRLLGLLEALRAGHIDFVRLNSLFVH